MATMQIVWRLACSAALVAHLAAVQAQSPPASDPAQSLRRVQARFVAPCCWRENLTIHRSPEADQMREEIRRLVETGKSEQEIVDYYVSRYGERILSEPRGLRFWVLTLIPVLAVLAGACGIVLWLLRMRRITTARLRARES